MLKCTLTIVVLVSSGEGGLGGGTGLLGLEDSGGGTGFSPLKQLHNCLHIIAYRGVYVVLKYM